MWASLSSECRERERSMQKLGCPVYDELGIQLEAALHVYAKQLNALLVDKTRGEADALAGAARNACLPSAEAYFRRSSSASNWASVFRLLVTSNVPGTVLARISAWSASPLFATAPSRRTLPLFTIMWMDGIA